MIEDGFARQREVASNEDFPVYLCLLAEALTREGRAAEAAQRLANQRAALEPTGLRLWIPELLRVTADTMLTADPSDPARPAALLNEAEDMAQTHGVTMLLLRIARTRLRLAGLTDPDRVPHALSRLRDALVGIPEPDDSPELRETERLLHPAPAIGTR